MMENEQSTTYEVKYTTLEIEGFPKPLIFEYHYMNGKYGRPHGLPTEVGRDPDTGYVVIQGWLDENGAYNRPKENGISKPAFIQDGEEPICEWYENGYVVKVSHPIDAYIDPRTGLAKYIFEGEQVKKPSLKNTFEPS